MLMRETDRQRMCVFVYLRGVEITEREREKSLSCANLQHGACQLLKKSGHQHAAA